MSDEKRPDFTIAELGNTYAGPNDRFIVSLIVGYQDTDKHQPATAKQAGAAALDLTTDDGSHDTHWYVFDRKTGELHMFEQGDLEHAAKCPAEVDDTPLDCGCDREDVEVMGCPDGREVCRACFEQGVG